MFEFEDHYWWFLGRMDILASLLDRHLEPRQTPRILDVGCGSGATLRLLSRYGQADGLDPFRAALQLCHRRDLHRLILADATRLPCDDGTYDLVSALDVLEHIEHDDLALAEMVRATRPGGQILLTVPAYQWLWSEHDEALDHFRRYTASQVGELCRGCGLEVQRLGYCITLLLPAAALLRFAQRLIGQRRPHPPHCGLMELPRPLNRLCLLTLQLEARLLRWVDLPFGISVVCLARRPEE